MDVEAGVGVCEGSKLIRAANSARLHRASVETFGLGLEGSAWGDRMSTQRGSPGEARGSGNGCCHVTLRIVSQ